MSERPATDPAEKIRFRCGRCARRFVASAKDVGKSSKCPGCGAAVVVPAASEPGFEKQDFSDVFGFPCRLCATQLYARPRHVGKKVRCPDCETTTVVPAPEAKPAPRAPAAMEGPQYEVFEGEEQPWGVDLARRAPKRIRVECRLCQTPMHVPPSAVGKRVVCPDCGTKTVVERPKGKPDEKVLRSPGPDYELDQDSPPPAPLHQGLYEEASKRPPAGYRDLVEREPEQQVGRPKPPLLAVLRGWLRFWFAPSMIAAWAGLSAGLAFTYGLLALILMALSSGLLSTIMLLVGPIMSFMIFYGVASAIFFEVVIDSSEGEDRVSDWPNPAPFEWIGPGITLLVALLVAFVPGFLLETYVLQDGYLPGAMELLAGLTLPWVLLAQLETGSTLGVVSPRLFWSIPKAPLSWLLFYAVTLSACWGMGVLLEWMASRIVVPFQVSTFALTAPLEVFLILSYARMLGRLAWVIGEAVPASSSED